MANLRNTKCACGSGKRYKNCCLKNPPVSKRSLVLEASTLERKSLLDKIHEMNIAIRWERRFRWFIAIWRFIKRWWEAWHTVV